MGIKPETRIVSDEWKAYLKIQDSYPHDTICHKYNFVDPNNEDIHTQRIENLWRYAKDIYPDRSTSESLKESYLHEFVYRKRFGDNTIHQMLNNIKEVYDWKKALYTHN